MKAAKLKIGFREWSKLPDFVETINEEDEMLTYEIDNTTALLVAPGECGLAWIEAAPEPDAEAEGTEAEAGA